MNRYLIPLCVFIGLIALLALGLRLDPSRVPSPFIDRPIPQFNLPMLHKLDRKVGSADLRGEVTLLNVWASWCVACRYEHVQLLKLARERGIRIYGLNYKDTHEDALRWLEAMGDPYVASAFDADGQVGIDVCSSGWDSEMICFASILDVKGQRYMFYNGNNYGETGFGLAVLER